MPLPTFEHLTSEKQTRIRDSLLTEFSQYPLAEAQVARIVTEAKIARGAFYKYFTDLNDAYCYLFEVAMQDIHTGFPNLNYDEPVAIDNYISATKAFIEGINNSKYQPLILMHFSNNESVLGTRPSHIISGAYGASHWAVEVLCHQTLRDALLDKENAEIRLSQLTDAIRQL
ncbi:TetR family transcriptional regulator [Paucilactobacillus oligofermentans DSM 15707 = LMG 22743]|uniref:TetR family transcriptional regulator n=1 Tax=Paucilactobacillus oligofermentans DSM 15707 = LMG 22743 TaxID=1423778 RepID=A0A0R1RFW6_9LACO|nr:TetR/AcrR family transcriptional regulator [Paucilactobacillus oligofermentans]KRL55644.1 TetR family transcriptional regulator [Paucilactobacillus oligofermentans DSM 15707 = LMG 22743]CUS25367.1 TetR family transcriptional regulator [Paucilactobacillus oligofermentans DSM 15707 = LMG 22743]